MSEVIIARPSGRRVPAGIGRAFGASGYLTGEALTLGRALELLARPRPDALVLYLDDDDAVQTIRNVSAHTSTPIIAVARTFRTAAVRVAALDAGASFCLAPPVSGELLMAIIHAAERRAAFVWAEQKT